MKERKREGGVSGSFKGGVNKRWMTRHGAQRRGLGVAYSVRLPFSPITTGGGPLLTGAGLVLAQ